MTPSRRIRLQHLVGVQVRDSLGRRAGHIEEIRASTRDGRCYVTEYLLGTGGLAERLSISGFSLLLLRVLGAQKQVAGARRVPWQKMDLTDPHHPRLRCTVEKLGQEETERQRDEETK